MNISAKTLDGGSTPCSVAQGGTERAPVAPRSKVARGTSGRVSFC